MICNNEPYGELGINLQGTLDSPSWEFNAYIRSSLFPIDLSGVNPAALNGMILYYRLMTKWSGLGNSTELSRVGLSRLVIEHLYAPEY
jgi:hypothetical protein